WNRRSRAKVERLQTAGRRLSRQNSRDAGQRPTGDAAGTGSFWRSQTDLLRPLDLQVRRGCSPWRGWRNSFAYERVGRLSMERGAHVEWILAVRHCAHGERQDAVSASAIVDH